jgi:hypothetical protein
MNTETKYIIYAIGGIGAVVLIIFLVNRYRKTQASKRMQMSPGMQSATGSNLENLPISIQMKITGTADWNNSTVKTNITFGSQTWAGDINPTTNKTETKNDQEIRITGGATATMIDLLKGGKVLKSAYIDFYNEKLNGFN